MMHVLLILMGLAISFFVPGIGVTTAFLVGAAGGLAEQITGAVWPSAKPSFVDPVNRPRPMHARHQLAGALTVVGIGIAIIIFALWAPLSVNSPWRLYGFYLGGMTAGTAVGILLTARKTREAHNRWVASMSPQPQLGTEQ